MMNVSSGDFMRRCVSSAGRICPGPLETFRLSNMTASPHHEPGARRVASRGPPNIPGMNCFSAFQVLDDGSTHRGQRKGSLSPSTKTKVARVRKIRACFRCQILRVAVCQQNALECLSEANYAYFISVMRSARAQSVTRELQARSVQ